MAITFGDNVTSLIVQKSLVETQNRLKQAIERLSTGKRINRAADDPAGMAMSMKLGVQLKSVERAQLNTSDALSMVQTAGDALTEIDGLLSQMHELAVESSTSGTMSSDERADLNTEFTGLRSEINRLTTSTEYNGQSLVDGSLTGGVAFQVGIDGNSASRITVTFGDADGTALSIDAIDISTVSNAEDAMTSISDAIVTLGSRRASLGSSQNRLDSAYSSLQDLETNYAAAYSRIMDADIARETANLTRQQILLQAGVAVLAQANQMPSIALRLLGL